MLVQVAGILDAEEALMLLEEGVDTLAYPLGPGVRTNELTLEKATAIIRDTHSAYRSILITYLDTAASIIAYASKLGVPTVQLHAPISFREVEILRNHSSLRILKSVIMMPGRDADILAEMELFAPLVDYFLLDSFDPVTGARGATGKTHDWKLSRELVQRSPRPVILAGGLNPENLITAIRTVAPAGVDVHTGIEDASGRKSPQKVRAFVHAARAAISLR